MICRKSDEESITITADYLRRGKIVIIPTDTVYGFSGIVDGRHYSYHTDEKINRIKKSDSDKPLIQLISKSEDIKKYTRDLIPDELLSKWPGALTIIVHTFEKDGNRGTTAFRCPDDEWLRKVVALCGAPIYTTSVNISGQNVLENVQDIKAVFGSEVPLIVDDGGKKGQKPSTIVKIEEDGSIAVVRAGAVEIQV